MRARQLVRLPLTAILLLPLLALPAGGQEETPWGWTDREGRARTRAELDEIIQEHQQWLQSEGQAGNAADLVGADLRGANLGAVKLSRGFLSGANLSQARLGNADLKDARLAGANLSGAFLLAANLQEADLTRADLRDADLTQADLSGADLSRAQLSGAELFRANLRGAVLRGADLTDADLYAADLSGATLQAQKAAGEDYREVNLLRVNLRQAQLRDTQISGVNLLGARLDGADLRGAVFEPTVNPDPRGVAAAENLETLTYEQNPYALIQLREQLQEAGFREPERKVTYALKKREAQFLWQRCREGGDWNACLTYWVDKALFDWTCQYGLSPHRPLLLFVGLWLVSSLIYVFSMHLPGPSGLYLIESSRADKSTKGDGSPIRPRAISADRKAKYFLLRVREELRLLRAGMYFSFTRALSFGFRRRALGRWLRFPTTRDYDIKSVGWPRTMGGLQALLSVYLIVLWALAYFDRPFQ